jgi:hypothetical protein
MFHVRYKIEEFEHNVSNIPYYPENGKKPGGQNHRFNGSGITQKYTEGRYQPNCKKISEFGDKSR